MYHYKEQRYGDFFWGALVGSTIATLTTLLFTTKKGIHIQNKICEKCQEIEETFTKSKNKVKGALRDTAHKAGDKLEEE